MCAAKQSTLISPRIVATDPNTPLAGMISIVSLIALKTPIAASKDEIVCDLSVGLGGFVLAGAGLAIVWDGGRWETDNGAVSITGGAIEEFLGRGGSLGEALSGISSTVEGKETGRGTN